MAGFDDIIPFFTIAVFAIGVALAIIFGGRLILLFRKAFSKDPEHDAETLEAKEVEGAFYWAAEFCRYMTFIIVLLVISAVIGFLLNPAPDFSGIFVATLGTYTVPLTGFIIAYWGLKTLPWIKHNAEVAAAVKRKKAEREAE